MSKDLGHGPRLTDEEYERRIMELHRALPPMPTKNQDEEVRRRELDLVIDHRLGQDFPKERRLALWSIQQQVERKRLRLGLKYLLRKLFTKSFVHQAQGLAGFMVDEYAKVLTKAELETFFDLKEGERPALPVDIDQLR